MRCLMKFSNQDEVPELLLNCLSLSSQSLSWILLLSVPPTVTMFAKTGYLFLMARSLFSSLFKTTRRCSCLSPPSPVSLPWHLLCLLCIPSFDWSYGYLQNPTPHLAQILLAAKLQRCYELGTSMPSLHHLQWLFCLQQQAHLFLAPLLSVLTNAMCNLTRVVLVNSTNNITTHNLAHLLILEVLLKVAALSKALSSLSTPLLLLAATTKPLASNLSTTSWTEPLLLLLSIKASTLFLSKLLILLPTLAAAALSTVPILFAVSLLLVNLFYSLLTSAFVLLPTWL